MDWIKTNRSPPRGWFFFVDARCKNGLKIKRRRDARRRRRDRMFPSSAPKKPASALPSSAPERPNAPPSPASSTDERPPRVEYDVDEAERARENFRLQGKAGYERVLAGLGRERQSLRETRQYLFGRLLNLQLEEAVLRDHLNERVNDAAGADAREMETRQETGRPST